MISGTFPGQPRQDPDSVFCPIQADEKKEGSDLKEHHSNPTR